MASWAFWTTTLHRSSEEYWELTPREIYACVAAFEDREEVHSARFGSMCATVWNALRTDKKQKWLSWTDFFKPKPKPRKPKTLADYHAQYRAAFKDKNGIEIDIGKPR